MKNIYMAIWYQCNQRCTGCPVFHNTNKNKSLTYEQIVEQLEQIQSEMRGNERVSITVSGGEPTLHPDFFRILDQFKERNFFVTLLTNADKFAGEGFCREFLKHIDIRRFVVVTTIHGSNYQIHEAQNNSKGSFDKSLSGLKFLSFRGVQVSIKHCITGQT